jgi:hypothetical protein
MRTTAAFQKLASTVAAIVAEFDLAAASEYQREDAERTAAEQATGMSSADVLKSGRYDNWPQALREWFANKENEGCRLANQRESAAKRIHVAHGEYTAECLRIFGECCQEQELIAARMSGDAVIGLAAETLNRHSLPRLDYPFQYDWLRFRQGVQKEVPAEIAALFDATSSSAV